MFHSPRKVARIVAIGLCLAAGSAQAEAPLMRWKIVKEYPHDSVGFTQGLVWSDGRLFESDGQYGQSRVAEKRLKDGAVLASTANPASEFGEGLALLGDSLWQLTWREGVLHRYNLKLEVVGALHYGGEGWGLASDGHALILSNGSATLSWIDPFVPMVIRSLDVRDGDTPVTRLNELEWVGGLIGEGVYANVWLTDRIARIDPASGQVLNWLDFSSLKAKAGITPEQEAHGAVLNGIAWKKETDTLLVTGKYWPKIYEIRLLVEGGR